MLSAKSRQGLGPMPYLRNQNVQWHHIDLSDVASMDFTGDERAKYRLQPGDLLICEGGEVGRCARWTQPSIEMCFQKALHRVRPRPGIETGWIEFFMRWAAETGRFGDRVQGSTIAHLPQRDLRALEVPIPPSAEQRRIIAAIEEHFSRLDAVGLTLERGLRSVVALRTSVLADAFKADGMLPQNWRRTKIGEVATVQLGRQRSPQHHAGPQMRPYLRAANVTWAGLSLDDVKQMNFDEGDFETYRLQPGDLLLNEASGSPNEVGKPAAWSGEIEDCCFQNTLLRLQARDIDPGYLYWYCYMAASTGRFGEAGRGVNIRHLGKQGLARFPIPVAPRTEQQRIVAGLQEQFQQSSECEASIHLALERTRALRRSILARAFEGQLVPRNLDEPVAVPTGAAASVWTADANAVPGPWDLQGVRRSMRRGTGWRPPPLAVSEDSLGGGGCNAPGGTSSGPAKPTGA